MTFQAYIDTIKQKTGLGPADFKKLAAEKGLLDAKAAVIKDWLKDEFDLGPGHAMALFATFTGQLQAPDARIDKQFSGTKAHWRETWEQLLATLGTHGEVGLAATDSYISLLKGTGKFAIFATTADRIDIGIKLKSADATSRFEAAGSWNSMVTHRVRITDPSQIDAELLDWLERAYAAA